MKKVLIVTTVSGFVPQFEMNNVKILQSLGCEIHYATNYHTPIYSENNNRLNNTGIIRHQIDFVRSPFSIVKNVKAYIQLLNVMKSEHYDLVHCHTPMGGVIARLVAKVTNTGPVFYTAHGFHFYNGAPLINWLLFYPIEKWLAKYTDVLLTINKEDYERTKKFKLKGNGKIVYINGVGINLTRFYTKSLSQEKKRCELKIPLDAFVITSVGEINTNKNHQVIIKSLSNIKHSNILYIICGQGNKKEKLQKLCKKFKLQDKVMFLGQRNDIPEILVASDCFAFPSLREGLGMAAIEAMAAGLPIITSRNRGTLEYAEDGVTGFICSANDELSFRDAIDKLYMNPTLRKKIGNYNKDKVKKFDIIYVCKIMKDLYTYYLS